MLRGEVLTRLDRANDRITGCGRFSSHSIGDGIEQSARNDQRSQNNEVPRDAKNVPPTAWASNRWKPRLFLLPVSSSADHRLAPVHLDTEGNCPSGARSDGATSGPPGQVSTEDSGHPSARLEELLRISMVLIGHYSIMRPRRLAPVPLGGAS